jgi:dodecin
VVLAQAARCADPKAFGAARASLPSIRREGFLLSLIVSSGDNGRMSNHIYKKIELVGSSPNGFEAAVKNALARAGKTVRNMRWFEVTETRGYLEDGKVGHWQVTLKVGFTLEE